MENPKYSERGRPEAPVLKYRIEELFRKLREAGAVQLSLESTPPGLSGNRTIEVKATFIGSEPE